MASRSKDRKWLGLTALMPAIAMVFTDQAVLPVALPTIQKQLEASSVELWWCINSYLLASAVLLLIGGKIGDRLGYRKTFLWGMITFALSSALCGLSPNISWLIGARALQGLGAALMIPATSPLIMSLFSQNQRGKATGINASVGSLFLILAPLIGGYFTQVLSWRWIFWINLPLAILGFFLVLFSIPKSPQGSQKLDFSGVLFFMMSGSSLIILIMQGSEWGWTSLASGSLFGLCLITTLFFYRREKKATPPLIDLSLFRHPVYKAVNISVFAIQFVLMIGVYRAIFFQDTLGLSPLKSGTILFFTSLPVCFMSPLGGWLADRFGPKVPLAMGFTLLIYSFFWLAFFIESSLSMIVLGLLAFGMGIPLIFTPSYSSAMGAVPPTKAGSAFGLLATVRAFSGTLGVAAIGSFTSHVQFHSFQTRLRNDPQTTALDPLFLEGLSKGIETPKEFLSPGQLHDVLHYLRESQITSFFSIHLAMGLILILAFAFVFALYRRKASHQLPETPAEGWD